MSTVGNGPDYLFRLFLVPADVSSIRLPILNNAPVGAELWVGVTLVSQRTLQSRSLNEAHQRVAPTLVGSLFVWKLVPLCLLRYTGFQRAFYYVPSQVVRPRVVTAIQ